MALEYDNEHCRIAAQMLGTKPDLLDYRLIEKLNDINLLVVKVGGFMASRQIIALAIVQWRESVADDFTEKVS